MRWQTQELYFRQFLMQTLGIPVLGKIFFCFPAGSSTSKFEDWIETELDIPAELKFQGSTAIKNAYAAATDYRNDTILVFPGAYDIGTELDWTKPQTHMVGCGGPNIGGDHSEPNVCIYTDTAGSTAANLIDIAAENCIFKGINFENYGANAANVAAVKVNDYGCWFENCRIAGNMTSQQNGAAAAASLVIGEAGMYPVFKNCQIGQDVWGVRTTANSGVINFNGSNGRPNGSDFINCRIVSVGDDANCAMVRVTDAYDIGRGHRFDNCFFCHFDSNASGSTTLARCFYTPSTSVQRHIVHLHNCYASGIDEWQTDDDSVVLADMPITGIGGGLARNPTGTVGN